MTPVIPSSASNISLISGAAFTRRKNDCLTRCYNLRKYTKQTSYAQVLIFPLSTSVRLFPRIRTCGLHHKPRIQVVSATGTDVAVEEPDSPVADKDSSEALGISSVAETSEKVSSKADTSPTQGQSRRSRPVRKSELPPVKNEELVPGATFTGKVRSIQPFGAFVDFGAFTDGLVHVSQLSDSFVRDVGTVVSIGEEVKVRLVEANTETGRISLTMRESDDVSKLQQSPGDTDKTRSPRRNTLKSNQRRDDKKTSKFVKGQDLDGKVKNLARAGSFISLPDGEEGFLPTEEEADDGLGSLMGASTLQVDQEVRVRVLRISRGRVTLTMKKEEDVGALDSKLSPGTVHTATNPFLLAFRKNKDIAAFLDEREKEEDSTEDSESSLVPSAIDETLENDKQPEHEVDVGAGTTVDASPPVIIENEEPESIVSDSLQTVDTAVESIEINAEVSSEILSPEGSVSSANPITEAAPATAEVEIGESEEAIEKDEPQTEPLILDTEASAPTVENEKVEFNADESTSSTGSNGQIDVPQPQESTSKGCSLTLGSLIIVGLFSSNISQKWLVANIIINLNYDYNDVSYNYDYNA